MDIDIRLFVTFFKGNVSANSPTYYWIQIGFFHMLWWKAPSMFSTKLISLSMARNISQIPSPEVVLMKTNGRMSSSTTYIHWRLMYCFFVICEKLTYSIILIHLFQFTFLLKNEDLKHCFYAIFSSLAFLHNFQYEISENWYRFFY